MLCLDERQKRFHSALSRARVIQWMLLTRGTRRASCDVQGFYGEVQPTCWWAFYLRRASASRLLIPNAMYDAWVSSSKSLRRLHDVCVTSSYSVLMFLEDCGTSSEFGSFTFSKSLSSFARCLLHLFRSFDIRRNQIGYGCHTAGVCRTHICCLAHLVFDGLANASVSVILERTWKLRLPSITCVNRVTPCTRIRCGLFEAASSRFHFPVLPTFATGTKWAGM